MPLTHKNKAYLLSLIGIIVTISITMNLSNLSRTLQIRLLIADTDTNTTDSRYSNSLSYLWKSQGISPSYHDNYWKLYCLSTSEHCLPITKCNTMKYIQNGNGEKISTCLDFLNNSNSECLIYSVGIANAYNWDISMARDFGCEVHSFDPTIDLPPQLAANVTFHKWGLRGSNANGSAAQYEGNGRYQGVSGEMLMLSDVIKRLGHEKRKIDILRIDCEGCEWEVFSHDQTQKIMCHVPQILTEFHYGMNFLPSVKNLTLVSKVYDFLNYCNFKEFFYEVNVHDASFDRKMNQQFVDNSYLDDITDHKGRPRCCREYGFLKDDV